MGKSRSRLLSAAIVCCAIAAGFAAAPAAALSPAVETLAASSVGEKGATLNGKVNPGGAETKAYFEYGTTTGYGSKTPEVGVGAGTSVLEHNQVVSGLSANTTYHYRIVATNPDGTGQGVDKTFTTVGPPSVSAEGASTESSGEAATLKASIDPNGQSTTYQFEYGTESGKYTNVAPIPAASAGSGFEPTAVEYKITGLTKGTYYYWRVSASNASGETVSEEKKLLSSLHPGVQIAPASGISRTEATLNATVSTVVFKTKYWFEYGTTESYGSKTATKELEGGKTVSASELISGLKANTFYHFRVVTENAMGTHIGPDQWFTTHAPMTLYQKGGAQLSKGSPLKAFSSSLAFSSESGTRYCSEAELSGELKENPGALQGVSTLKMQTEGGACPLKPSWTVKYSTPTSGITIDYSRDPGAPYGTVRTSKFVLVQTVYFEKTLKVAECEYNLVLSGYFNIYVALELALSGKTEVIKGGTYCPGAETVTGNFVVTSEGKATEAQL